MAQTGSTISRMNISRFRAAVDDFMADGASSKSIFVSGVHGIGKSTVIKSIAKAKAKELGLEFVSMAKVNPDSVLAVVDPQYTEATSNNTGVWLDVNKHYIFYDCRLSQRDYVDFVGAIDKSKGITRFIPVDWVVVFSQTNVRGMLFFDELDQAPRMVQNAAFEIVQDRRIDKKDLSSGVSIFAAGNSGTGLSIYGAKPMSAALNDRFWKILLTPTKQEWIDWALNEAGTDGHKILARYFEDHVSADYLDYPEARGMEQDAVLPSRRSWGDFGFNLARLLAKAGYDSTPKEADKDEALTLAGIDVSEIDNRVIVPKGFDWALMTDVLSGYVGEEAAIAFKTWLQDQTPKASLFDIINGTYVSGSVTDHATILMIMREFSNNVHLFVEVGGEQNGKKWFKPNENAFKFAAFIEDVYEVHREIASYCKSILTSARNGVIEKHYGVIYATLNKALIGKGGIALYNNNPEDGPLSHMIAYNASDRPEEHDKYQPKYSKWAIERRAENLRAFNERVMKEQAALDAQTASGGISMLNEDVDLGNGVILRASPGVAVLQGDAVGKFLDALKEIKGDSDSADEDDSDEDDSDDEFTP